MLPVAGANPRPKPGKDSGNAPEGARTTGRQRVAPAHAAGGDSPLLGPGRATPTRAASGSARTTGHLRRSSGRRHVTPFKGWKVRTAPLQRCGLASFGDEACRPPPSSTSSCTTATSRRSTARPTASKNRASTSSNEVNPCQRTNAEPDTSGRTLSKHVRPRAGRRRGARATSLPGDP